MLESSALLSYMAAHSVSCAYFVPSQLGVLVQEQRLSECRSLRYVISGGEKLSLAVLREFQKLSRAELHHSYGPTETSIAATEWTCEVGAKRVLMGSPIGNTQVYVLDKHMEPLPVDVAGELYIGGVGVGRGYKGRAELTAERFVPDPFSAKEGARLYRTGDLVRYLSDGQIEFLGRADGQIKVHGHRIELGEIESALRQLLGISNAAAVVHDDRGNEKRIVGYVVADAGVEVKVDQLLAQLKQRLPNFMLPAVVVAIDALPLTVSGKVDRRELAARAVYIESNRTYAAPRTLTEKLLATLWSSVLKVNQVGVNDNFFELGGHSLLAIQLMTRIRETFSKEITLRHFFERPTLAELAQVVDAALRQVEPMSIPKLSPASRDIDLPLSFAQRRLWLLDQLETNRNLYNLSGGLRFRGPLNFIAIEQALAEVFRRHEVLSTRFVTRDGQPRQLIAVTGPVFLPIVDLSRVDETRRVSTVQKLSVEEARRPFDLTRGPLLRAGLIKLSEEDHIGLFTMHHIVSDAWSMSLLLHELTRLYTAFNRGETSPLPELKIQYHDFAVWQQTYLTGELLAEQVNYWKRQLADAPVLLNLPLDRPRPAIQSYSGGQESLILPPQITDDLNKLCRRENMTQYMVLLASFQLLLAWYSGQDDILVGAPVAGRDQIESEVLVGFFVNTLVLRTRLSGNPDFREVLRRVRETLLGAYAHQNVPFEMLVETLMPERSLAHSPLFQVVVGLQNIPVTATTDGDLVYEDFPRNVEATHYDLELTMVQAEEGLFTTLTYNTDLFDAATIRRMLSLWHGLSAYLIAHPEADLTVIFEHLEELDQQERLAAEVEFKHNALQQLKRVKRRVVTHIE
jgi:acyl carrier protein